MARSTPVWTWRTLRVWDLLGIVELVFHPALALALLAGVGLLVSPMPAVRFDPVSVTTGGGGVPLTWLLGGVVVVDFVADAAQVVTTEWFLAPSERDDE